MKKFSYDLPKDLYNGMRVRPTMDTIANDVIKGPYRIKYPNRDATFYLNSPQFLSLLQDTNVGLAEQSKNLAKEQIRESELRAKGRGGMVDAAMAPTLSGSSAGDSDAENARRLREAMERQEEQRREQERIDYEFARYERRQREEQRSRAQELARATAASSSSHPSAAAAAAQAFAMSDTQLARMAEQMLRQARMGSLLTPRPEDIDITYFASQGDAMSDAPPATLAVKRRSAAVEPTSPKGKARIDEPKLEEVEEGSPKSKSANPVKKTAVKRVQEYEQGQELQKLLNKFTVGEVKTKYKNQFGEGASIMVLTDRGAENIKVDKAKKVDIIKEYVEKISSRGKLENELRAIKEELQRRETGSSR